MGDDALPQTRRLLDTWKNGFAIKASCVLAIYTESNHECTLSEPTAVTHSAGWFHPDTCPPVEYAIPGTTRLFNTRKTSITMNISQYVCIFYWTKP